MGSYLKKIYNLTSGVAISYDIKVGKTATTTDLKKLHEFKPSKFINFFYFLNSYFL